MYGLRWLFLPLMLTLHGLSAAHGSLRAGIESIDLSPYVQVQEEKTGQLNHSQLPTREVQQGFHRPAMLGSVLNLGMQQSPYWVKVSLQIEPGTPQEWVLDLPFSGITHAQAYLAASPDAQGLIELPQVAGYRYHAWPVRVIAPEVTIYLRVQSMTSLTLPLQLQSAAAFAQDEQNHLLLQGLYFGALFLLLLYSFAFGLSARDHRYVLFSCFMLFAGTAMLLGNALLDPGSWAAHGHLEKALEAISFAMAGGFAMAFTRSFAKTAAISPRLDWSLRLITGAYVLIALCTGLLAVTGQQTLWIERPSFALTCLSALLIFGVLALAQDKGDKSNIFFASAWVCICAGALMATLRLLDILPTYPWLLYVMQLAMGVAAVLFSFALFLQVHQQQQDHQKALMQTAQARQQLIEHLRESESRLEALVQRRTQALSEALGAEKRMREQYIRFGAMISHEFRNPLSVIETQTTLLERELVAGIDRASKRIGSVRAATQRLALLFEKWLQSDRLNNLQERLQPTAMEMDTWLSDLVQKCHSYHVNHTVILTLHSQIGCVNADEQLLRIAVLNLIDNACKYSPPDTTVTVTAFKDQDRLCILVSDQGRGIADEFKRRIFEEYFRIDPDSPVLGVGLGLPFVRKIAHLHGGSIEALDNPSGMGACFRLCIKTQGKAD